MAGNRLLPWKVVEQLVPTDPFEALVVDPVLSSSLSSSSWKPNLLNPLLVGDHRRGIRADSNLQVQENADGKEGGRAAGFPEDGPGDP